MDEQQVGLLQNTTPENIVKPVNSTGVRLFKNTTDGKYYIKKSDDSIEEVDFNFPFNVSETTLDITGLDYIDLTGIDNYGIVNLTSSNPSETVVRILNSTTNAPKVFRPASGLEVIFEDLNLLSVGANMKMPNDSIAINGTGFGYITIQRRTILPGARFFALNYLDTYA